MYVCITVHVTLVLQLGQLFAQGVVAFLQQPLLLLHALHVLGQRADLCLMLYVCKATHTCMKFFKNIIKTQTNPITD